METKTEPNGPNGLLDLHLSQLCKLQRVGVYLSACFGIVPPPRGQRNKSKLYVEIQNF